MSFSSYETVDWDLDEKNAATELQKCMFEIDKKSYFCSFLSISDRYFRHGKILFFRIRLFENISCNLHFDGKSRGRNFEATFV